MWLQLFDEMIFFLSKFNVMTVSSHLMTDRKICVQR
jgi:hypothetical protein